jgi:hypothetical protein
MAMAEGKANPMKLFTSGKLKISGNVMASQKLDFLTKIDPKVRRGQAGPRWRGATPATGRRGRSRAPAPSRPPPRCSRPSPTSWRQPRHREGKVGVVYLLEAQGPRLALDCRPQERRPAR